MKAYRRPYTDDADTKSIEAAYEVPADTMSAPGYCERAVGSVLMLRLSQAFDAMGG